MYNKQGQEVHHGYPMQYSDQYPAAYRPTPGAVVVPPRDPEVGGYPPQEEDERERLSAGQLLEEADKMVRMGFIRKVYGILTLQLTVTFGLTAIFTFNDAVKDYVQGNVAMFYSAWILSIGFLIALACCPTVARTYPQNYICLAAFTLLESYLVGVISSFYDTDTVFIALGLTIGVFLALTAFAWQTKIDFTNASGIMMSLLVVLIITGILAIFIPSLRLVYAGLGAIVFSAFIVYDTQLIVGGKHRKMKFGVDDYVIAALSLYIDVVQLFLFLLRILGGRR
eukprot:gb/GECG01004363.1/.p1 GENE.gb/GECG01004363.1/~~gb/GECG01004363.1/.p1  ORF type:complete len:282 (+),score=28.03 gb/GECG01004363.1/:1-846(+)